MSTWSEFPSKVRWIASTISQMPSMPLTASLVNKLCSSTLCYAPSPPIWSHCVPTAANLALENGAQKTINYLPNPAIKCAPHHTEIVRRITPKCALSSRHSALSTLSGNPHSVIHFAGTNAINRYDPTVPYKLNLIRSIFYYFADQQYLATDPTVKRFKDWNEILRHAKGGDNDQDAESVDKELDAAVKFVEKHGDQTPQILDLIVSRSGAHSQAIASFSTAHRAKG